MNRQFYLGLLVATLFTTTAHAQIYRWDNGQVIPGTEGIKLGPGVQLNYWYEDSHNLRYGDFKGNLSQASFAYSWLDDARFVGANLTGANLGDSTLTNANLTGANLSGAVLNRATLTNANLSGALVTGASFFNTTAIGFTSEQLYSTASYQAKDLHGIGLERIDLTGWNFSGQNLAGAYLNSATLTNANLTGAVVTGTRLGDTTGFTAAQLYSTQSYAAKDLHGIGLWLSDLTGWDFHDQNLTKAYLNGSTLTKLNLTGANLANAYLNGSTLTDANLSGAVVTGTQFHYTTGFTAAQLYWTQSYAVKDLHGIGLGAINLTGWDFSGQNLTRASFFANNPIGGILGYGSNLTNANLTGANLTYANLNYSTLTSANLTGAVVTGDPVSLHHRLHGGPALLDPELFGQGPPRNRTRRQRSHGLELQRAESH